MILYNEGVFNHNEKLLFGEVCIRKSPYPDFQGFGLDGFAPSNFSSSFIF